MLSGDNGILKQATKAKEQTENQSTLEQVKLSVTAAIANENRIINKNILDKDLKSYGFTESTVDEENNYTTTKGERSFEISNYGDIFEIVTEVPIKEVSINTKYVDLKSENKVAVIPEKFKVSSIEEEQQINKGLVVIAPDGSEFVWVPVDNPSSMYGINEDGKYLGKLYTFKDSNIENNKELNWSLSEDGTMSWIDPERGREPDVLVNSGNGDDSTKGLNALKNIIGIEGTDDKEILGKWKIQLQNEFEDMIESIEKNKGFYVGRFETSLRIENEKKVAQSIRGKVTATADPSSGNLWYGLYQYEKEYSQKNNLASFVGSSMIWGSQYDQMMIWMQNSGINVASANPLPGVSANTGDGSGVGTTGTVEEDKLNNIYDLLGNGWEWTLEGTETVARIRRRNLL